jgi:glycosyltransferase involved in cell wall biosynthesis
MNAPLVSVIVPIYGVERYIEQCVRTLMEQTLHDVEYVFVDDCTPDNSMEVLWRVLEDYPDRKGQVKVLHNEKNQGLPRTRRVGLKECTGKYIIQVDSDDFVSPDYCEKLYAKASKEQADIVWCDFYKQQGKQWGTFKQAPEQNSSVDSEIRSLLLSHRQGALWNHLIRRDLYNTIVYFPVHNMAEDLTVLIQMYTAAHRLTYVPEALYYYRYNEDSLSHADGPEQDHRLIRQMEDMEANVNLMERSFSERGVSQRFHNEFVFRKFFNKRWVLPALHSSRDCSLWRHCHADINAAIYFNPYVPLKQKVTAMLVQCGVYPWVKKSCKLRV